MAENLTRSKGRPRSYQLDRGGTVAESGPFIGEVMNNRDPARTGRIQVYIPEFGSNDRSDSTTWRTVRYLSPFYGTTPHSGSSEGTGTGNGEGNSNSYGMWFTVPDVGVKVLCFFVNGDANQGYYVGSVPDPDLLHMIPAVGASENFVFDNDQQAQKFANATRLPVAELNNKNEAIREAAQGYSEQRPVHAVVAATMFQQGVINDRVRGPIGSSSNRESPSAVFGISTPGRPIYQSGVNEYNIRQSLNTGAATKKDFKVVGRRGGHSIVMDDGDIEGNDNLIRIRTSKGHQITLSDDGNCLHIMHANGQSWVELGKEGTIDMYAANSVNVRSSGTINMHSDEDVNIYAGRNLSMHSKKKTFIESQDEIHVISEKDFVLHSDKKITMSSDGTLAISSESSASINAGGNLVANGALVLLNTNGALPSTEAKYAIRTTLSDSTFADAGWVTEQSKLDSICTRVPAHEPWDGHNLGVPTNVSYGPASQTQPNDSVSSKLNSVTNIGVQK